jgi:hypothetical protein
MAKDWKKNAPRAAPKLARVECAASFGGKGELRIDEKGIAVIRPAKTKHGLREHWRELEFAQLAIQALHGARPSKHLNLTKLWRDGNAWLQSNPEYLSADLGKISPQTFRRALKQVVP